MKAFPLKKQIIAMYSIVVDQSGVMAELADHDIWPKAGQNNDSHTGWQDSENPAPKSDHVEANLGHLVTLCYTAT